MRRLADKIAVVVGAGQTPGETIGNGRASALRFAQEGATVLCVDRNLASAEDTVALISDNGGNASALQADITLETDCEEITRICIERYQRLDILHNNVGIGRGDRGVTSMTESAWDEIFTTNVKGIMLTCKHAVPVMRAQGAGVITNISSVAAVCAVGLVAYKSSKAALNAYTHALDSQCALRRACECYLPRVDEYSHGNRR